MGRSPFPLHKNKTMKELRVCALCGRSEEYVSLESHHVYRRRNSDEVIWLCSTPHPFHKLSCHRRAHLDIELAKQLGIYKVYNFTLDEDESTGSDRQSSRELGENKRRGSTLSDSSNQE